jgi:hypothetical protein
VRVVGILLFVLLAVFVLVLVLALLLIRLVFGIRRRRIGRKAPVVLECRAGEVRTEGADAFGLG